MKIKFNSNTQQICTSRRISKLESKSTEVIQSEEMEQRKNQEKPHSLRGLWDIIKTNMNNRNCKTRNKEERNRRQLKKYDLKLPKLDENH